jgi:hypothetical protein
VTAPRIHAGHLQAARVEVVHIPGDAEPIYRVFLDGPDRDQVVLIGTEFDLTELLTDTLARAIDPVRPSLAAPTPARLHLAAGEQTADVITRLPHQFTRPGGAA